MPARRAHDVTEEHVGEAARDAPRIERRERRHDVLGRAERVVLVPVLDVRDAVGLEEPGVELDARLERGLGFRVVGETEPLRVRD